MLSIVAALGYTGGPVPYGYRGYGEVFVFVFFGLVATAGTRFVYDQVVGLDAWIGGIVMGCLATAILVANNIRDLATDAAAGKRTLAVKLGRHRTRTLFSAVVLAAFAIVAVSVLVAEADFIGIKGQNRIILRLICLQGAIQLRQKRIHKR